MAPATATEPAAMASSAQEVDVLVVGGGINGTGIARDLAGRGWRVVLCEQDDLASHTSSSSTKLVHGGLRYLEHHEFGLVRRALQEREVLLRCAPHLVRPLRFVMPHDPAMRPAWLIRTGLFLYDHLARRGVLPASEGVRLAGGPLGDPLQPRFSHGFAYSDGWVDDARLVVLNALDARMRGAEVLTRTACRTARPGPAGWDCTLQAVDGAPRQLRARALVNATGPWAGRFLRECVASEVGEPLAHRRLRLVKGSHIVVPRCFGHDHAYLFQNPDRRILFAIPYEGKFTLIGTTDVEFSGDPGQARIAAAETDYLCAQASRYFRAPVRREDVVWSYAGVRPLLEDESDDPAQVTRDYLLEMDTRAAPLLSVWGGKLTTFRKLAEEAAGLVGRALGRPGTAWTARALLPGGDFSGWIGVPQAPQDDFERLVAAVQRRYAWLAPSAVRRTARAYGSRVDHVLRASRAAMGGEIAPGLHEAELDYLRQEEWATCGDDVLWRRSKLGLHYRAPEREQVGLWLAGAPVRWREVA